jgi:hypothetical protein
MKYLAYMGGYSESGEAAGSGRSVEEQVGGVQALLHIFACTSQQVSEGRGQRGAQVAVCVDVTQIMAAPDCA